MKKALIFNSGRGIRMDSMTAELPKCLIPLGGGETILHRQVKLLREQGVKEIVITVGYKKELVIKACMHKDFEDIAFVFIDNPRYKSTNYIYSMHLARGYLNEELWLLHGDLVFESALLTQMKRSPHASLCLYDPASALVEKDFKCRVTDGLLREVSVTLSGEDSYNFQPLYRLSKTDIGRWVDIVGDYIDKKADNVYAENALNEILPEMEIYAMSYKDYFISEIDTKADYDHVVRYIKHGEAGKE